MYVARRGRSLAGTAGVGQLGAAVPYRRTARALDRRHHACHPCQGPGTLRRRRRLLSKARRGFLSGPTSCRLGELRRDENRGAALAGVHL